jgi:hypothetical protein
MVTWKLWSLNYLSPFSAWANTSPLTAWLPTIVLIHYSGRCHLWASPAVCSVWDAAKIFFTSKFSYLLFCNPTHQTETGTANRWGTTSSKPPGPIIMMGESETVTRSQIIYITLFSVVCCAFYTPPHTVQLCWAKTVFLSQTSTFWVFFIEFYCVGWHIEHFWIGSYPPK